MNPSILSQIRPEAAGPDVGCPKCAGAPFERRHLHSAFHWHAAHRVRLLSARVLQPNPGRADLRPGGFGPVSGRAARGRLSLREDDVGRSRRQEELRGDRGQSARGFWRAERRYRLGGVWILLSAWSTIMVLENEEFFRVIFLILPFENARENDVFFFGVGWYNDVDSTVLVPEWLLNL